MVLVNRIIFLILLSLFKYCGASILVESRGYRVERRGVGVFIHLLILFLGGEGRTAMAASMAWQNSAKTYFKRNHDRSRQRLDVPDRFTLLIFMAIHPLFKNIIF